MKAKQIVIIVTVSLLILATVTAQQVSHPASEVEPGEFQSGDYSFPQKVGIGSNTPTRALYVRDGAYLGDWLRIGGNNGLYFPSYGGGWRMTDGSWLRSYQDKGILTGGEIRGGNLRTNNNLCIGGDCISDWSSVMDTDWVESGGNVYRSGGNVGVGTSSPNAPLNIENSGSINSPAPGGDLVIEDADARIELLSDDSNWGSLRFGDSSDNIMGGLYYDHSNDVMRWYVNNGWRMAVDSAGRLGVGTSSPVDQLHISSGGETPLRLETSSGVTTMGSFNSGWSHFVTDRPRFWFNKEVTLNTGNIGSYNENLNLRTSGTTRVTILDSDGNVGVGTSSPSYKLHALGDVYANGGWLRVSGNKGLYFQSHGGGWRMTDNTWVRSYNNKPVYSGGEIRSGNNLRAPIFYDLNDANFYVNPASTSNLNTVEANNVRSNNLYDGDGGSRIEVQDDLDLNSNNLCLGGDCRSSWPSTTEEDTLDSVADRGRSTNQWLRSPRFEDYDDANFYVDPASTSRLAQIRLEGGLLYEGDGSLRVRGEDNLHLQVDGNNDDGNRYMDVRDGGNNWRFRVYESGNAYVRGDLRLYGDQIYTPSGSLRVEGEDNVDVQLDRNDNDSNRYFAVRDSKDKWRFLVYEDGNAYLRGGWLRIKGDKGLYFQDHGGGWYMNDNTWLRVNNNKNIYTGGEIRSESRLNSHGDLIVRGNIWDDSTNWVEVNDHLNMQGHVVRNVGGPSQSDDAATKGYVDANSGYTGNLLMESRLVGQPYTCDGTYYEVRFCIGGACSNWVRSSQTGQVACGP